MLIRNDSWKDSSVIVEGAVHAKHVLSLRDDPFLPPDWNRDEETREIVEEGEWTKWRVEVSQWTKGRGPTSIYVVLPSHSPLFPGSGPSPNLNIPEGSGRYRFWLEPEEWIRHDHFLLMQAERLGDSQ